MCVSNLRPNQVFCDTKTDRGVQGFPCGKISGFKALISLAKILNPHLHCIKMKQKCLSPQVGVKCLISSKRSFWQKSWIRAYRHGVIFNCNCETDFRSNYFLQWSFHYAIHTLALTAVKCLSQCTSIDGPACKLKLTGRPSILLFQPVFYELSIKSLSEPPGWLYWWIQGKASMPSASE